MPCKDEERFGEQNISFAASNGVRWLALKARLDLGAVLAVGRETIIDRLTRAPG